MNSNAHNEARECLMDQVLSATTREEIATARQALREWIAQYPEEEGMSDGFEQLSLLQDIIEMQEAQALQGTKRGVSSLLHCV
jgi:hypothetical protein